MSDKDKWMWRKIRDGALASGKDDVDAAIFATEVFRLVSRDNGGPSMPGHAMTNEEFTGHLLAALHGPKAT